MHCIVCIVFCAVFIVQGLVCSYLVCSVECAVYSVYSAYSVQCVLHIFHISVQCGLPGEKGGRVQVHLSEDIWKIGVKMFNISKTQKRFTNLLMQHKWLKNNLFCQLNPPHSRHSPLWVFFPQYAIPAPISPPDHHHPAIAPTLC